MTILNNDAKPNQKSSGGPFANILNDREKALFQEKKQGLI
jgi:hypothetical protein